MSNALAIAAVTATLRRVLDRGLNVDVPGTLVRTRPPDQVRDREANQVNLFLYQTTPNAAWRNIDLPGRSSTGSEPAGPPPLALNLYYLVSAYGRDGDDLDPISHRLLARAMAILHAHAVLDPAEIRSALPGNDLHAQAERVKITLQPLSLEELTKLSSAFQAPYRISVAYEVSVVLIGGVRD